MTIVLAYSLVQSDRSSLEFPMDSELPGIRDGLHGLLKLHLALIINDQFSVNHITEREKENRSSRATEKNPT